MLHYTSIEVHLLVACQLVHMPRYTAIDQYCLSESIYSHALVGGV